MFDPFATRIDGVFLPSINRNPRFDVSELRPPTEIVDSESDTSPVLRSSKNNRII